MKGMLSGLVALTLGFALVPAGGSAQSLADFDYEYLSFRGMSLEWGYIWPTRVDPTYTVGTRIDLGYLGPGLRIVPGLTYWSSSMKEKEVRKLEERVGELIDPTSSYDPVAFGEIDWSDLVLSLDGHFVWSVPFDLLSYVGAGVSAHIMNGEGSAISGTFVEDLLDSFFAGVNFHAGLEYPLSDLFRVYGLGRYEILGDLRYMELRMGGQVMLGPSAPGEGR
jgi:hypothetical protein